MTLGPLDKSSLLFKLCDVIWPMELKNDMQTADVDLDSVAFHSLVGILESALRQLVEACC